jgi:hypothetical protein
MNSLSHLLPHDLLHEIAAKVKGVQSPNRHPAPPRTPRQFRIDSDLVARHRVVKAGPIPRSAGCRLGFGTTGSAAWQPAARPRPVRTQSKKGRVRIALPGGYGRTKPPSRPRRFSERPMPRSNLVTAGTSQGAKARSYQSICPYPGVVSVIGLVCISCVLVMGASSCKDGASPPSEAEIPERKGLSWSRLPDAPSPRTEVTATTAGARVFVIGGFGHDGRTVATVEIYDSTRSRWSSGPDLPIAVNHAMSASVGRSIYVLGGYLGPGLSNPTDRAFVLRGSKWLELPSMPEARAAGGAAAIADSLYVAGGVGSHGLAADMLVFDTSSQQWSTTQGPPTQREHLGVAAARGRLYVVGGRTGGIGSNLGAAEVFDPSNGVWSTLPDLPTPRGGMAAAATSNGLVVAAGGEADATFDEAEVLDVRRGRWLPLPPMPTARHGLGAAAVGTVLYVIAGGTEPGYSISSATEAIDLRHL